MIDKRKDRAIYKDKAKYLFILRICILWSLIDFRSDKNNTSDLALKKYESNFDTH